MFLIQLTSPILDENGTAVYKLPYPIQFKADYYCRLFRGMLDVEWNNITDGEFSFFNGKAWIWSLVPTGSYISPEQFIIALQNGIASSERQYFDISSNERKISIKTKNGRKIWFDSKDFSKILTKMDEIWQFDPNRNLLIEVPDLVESSILNDQAAPTLALLNVEGAAIIFSMDL